MNTPMNVWLRILPLLLITSCGFKKLSYKYADWFITKKTYQYLGEKDGGKDQIEPIVKNFLKQAEVKDVPKFISHLKAGQKILTKSPLRESDVGPWIKKTRNLMKGLVDDYMIALIPYIKTLSKEDLINIQANLKEANEEALEKFKDPVERITDRFEKLLGSIDRKQEAFIKNHITSFDDPIEKRMKNRLLKQKEFLGLIQGKNWRSLERFFRAKFFSRPKDYIERNQKAIVALLPTLKASQINHLKDQIKDYIEFLEWVQTRGYYQ
jgi:hypothetical protein